MTALRFVIGTLLLVASSCKQDSPKASQETVKPQEIPQAAAKKIDNSEHDFPAQQCQPCHPAIVEEWTRSIHGNATLSKDPLFALMFEKAKSVVGDKVEKGCRKCHNPMWQAGASVQRASAEGVTCVVCHKLGPEHVNAEDGAAKTALLDPTRAPNASPQELCLSCHAQRKTGKGVPICTTGSENAHGGGSLCVDCHMAPTDGHATTDTTKPAHRSHVFPGGHVAAFVQPAAALALTKDSAASEVIVTITPVALGHSLPTGTPMRHIIVELIATDAEGKEIWRNRPVGEALLARRESIFMRAFSDAEGKSPVPPFASVGEPSDNRLQNATSRVLRYPIPKGATIMQATLRYYLAPAKVLDAANAPASWKQPVLMSSETLRL